MERPPRAHVVCERVVGRHLGCVGEGALCLSVSGGVLTPMSFPSQGLGWVEARRAPGRQVAGQKRDAGEARRNRAVG